MAKSSLRSTQSKFHIGQAVQVVAGALDPDYGTPIDGWSGLVEDIVLSDDGDGSWLYNLCWDRRTLNAMGRQFHRRCEKDGFDFTRMVLAEYELEAVNAK